jgi:hypothetical protein
MQRRVDRRGDAVLAECCGRMNIDHLVLEGFAAIARFELLELVRRSANPSNRRSESPRSLTAAPAWAFPQRRGARFSARVAAAEVGDADRRRAGSIDIAAATAVTGGWPAVRSSEVLDVSRQSCQA